MVDYKPFRDFFDSVDVIDIGLRSLLKSVMFDILGMGATSAIFHACGTVQLRNEQFKMSVMAGAKRSAYIFDT